jgi:hypothetical protein
VCSLATCYQAPGRKRVCSPRAAYDRHGDTPEYEPPTKLLYFSREKQIIARRILSIARSDRSKTPARLRSRCTRCNFRQ